MNEDNKQDKQIAVIATKVSYIESDVKDIKATLKILAENYVNRAELTEWFTRIHEEQDKRFEGVHKRITENRDDIDDNRRELDIFKAQVKTWGSAAIIAIGIIQFLISKFL